MSLAWATRHYGLELWLTSIMCKLLLRLLIVLLFDRFSRVENFHIFDALSRSVFVNHLLWCFYSCDKRLSNSPVSAPHNFSIRLALKFFELTELMSCIIYFGLI